MTAQQFQELIQRYKEGSLSEAGWSALREALAEGMYDDVLEEDIRAVFDSPGAHKSWDASREQELWNKIQVHNQEEPVDPANHVDAIGVAHSEAPTKLISFYRRPRLYWPVAAAAAILLLAGAAYLLYTPNEKQAPVAVVPGNAVPPGTNRAYLTLAGGQRLLLDDTTKGAIASQGGVQVIKSGNGQLAYAASSSKLQAASEAVYNTITTPRGGQYQVLLADGTKVWLNAASSLRYPTTFSGTERRVELSGEAYFEVQHNAAQPFRVQAGEQLIEDIGTAFNINAYTDEKVAKTTLLEGSVKVTGKNTLIIQPGQQAQWQADGELHLAAGVDTEEVMAWKNGQFSFANADFASLMREVSRWYDVTIHYSGAVPTLHVFALLDRHVYLSTVLGFLQKNGVRLRQEGREITILP